MLGSCVDSWRTKHDLTENPFIVAKFLINYLSKLRMLKKRAEILNLLDDCSSHLAPYLFIEEKAWGDVKNQVHNGLPFANSKLTNTNS